MARRIEVELTSKRDDGELTWRAAGAREPRGLVAADLLPAGAKVGDVLRVEIETAVDGIEIVAVLPSKEREKASATETIEILGSRREGALVTTNVSGGRSQRRDRGGRPPSDAHDDRGDRGGRGDRKERKAPRKGEGRGQAPARARAGGKGDERRPRGARPDRPRQPQEPTRPAAKRLRAQRAHRQAILEGLPEEQRPLAELLLQGGMPALRQAIDRQRDEAKVASQPALHPQPLLELAEQLLPRLREAEWRDRADAAMKDLDELDLRDLRSVVTAAETGARDDEARALADSLRSGLTRRLEREQAEWMTELAELLRDGRIVRALRLSSRPPKAGALLPADIAGQLAEQASAALTAEISAQRWGTVLEAVAFSPVRQRVAATSIPDSPPAELKSAVQKLADRIPVIASQFGVTVQRRNGASKPVPQPTH
jgi:hypothetical protein